MSLNTILLMDFFTIIYGLTLVLINTMMKPELNKSLKT